MKLVLVAGVVVLLAGLFAAFMMMIIYGARGNAIDWLILTFGNEEAVRQVRRRRQLPPEG